MRTAFDHAGMSDNRELPRPLVAPRPGLCVPVRIDPTGRIGPTPWLTRGRLWRRCGHGWYVPASVLTTLEQRILEASVHLPDVSGVTGWASLAWRGARWFDGVGVEGMARAVPLVSAHHDIRAQPGIAISAERLDPRDIEIIDDVPVTTAARSVWFESRYQPSLIGSVRAIDMAAFDDLVTIAELWDWSHEHPGWTGAPRFREALSLADENAWSPREVDPRVIWMVVADLPRLFCNQPIFDRRGNLIGTPDLLDLEAGLVIEYDGPTHLRVAQRARDVRREELFRRHGLEYMVVVAPDLGDEQGLAARMHRIRRRARFQAESERSWTIAPPPWWIPTTTVADRRALTDELRSKLLGHRKAA